MQTMNDYQMVDDYMSEEEIEQFYKLHFNKVQLLRDAKDFLLSKKEEKAQKHSTELEAMFSGALAVDTKTIMDKKINVVNCIDPFHSLVKEYLSTYNKISEV